MKLCFASLGFAFLLVSSAWGGENPSIYLTGNPAVDFFGSHISPDMITPQHQNAIDDLSPVNGSGRSRKSPWLAGVMSFAIPGAGQAYANDYTKSVIFVAAEIASWAIHLSYAKKGDDQEVLFKAYANQHYSVVRYVDWTLDHLNSLTNGNTPNNQDAAYYAQQIYGPVVRRRIPMQFLRRSAMSVGMRFMVWKSILPTAAFKAAIHINYRRTAHNNITN